MRSLALAFNGPAGALPAPDPFAIGRAALDALKGIVAAGIILMAVAFTNAGTSVLTNRAIGAGTAPTRTGWGTGVTAAVVTQTDLVTEASETLSAGRVVSTESRVTTTNTNDTLQYVGTITAAGTKTISENALFDANSSGATVPNAQGNMFMRSNFTGMGVNASDSITFTNKLQIAANAV